MENCERLTREEFLAKMARYYDNDCDIMTAAIIRGKSSHVLELGLEGVTYEMLACIILAIIKNYPEAAVPLLERMKDKESIKLIDTDGKNSLLN